MKKLSESALSRIRWVLIILSLAMWPVLEISDYFIDNDSDTMFSSDTVWSIMATGTFVLSLLALFSLLIRNNSISKGIRVTLLILPVIGLILSLAAGILYSNLEVISWEWYWTVNDSGLGILFVSATYCYTSYLDRVERILVIFIILIAIGILANRFASEIIQYFVAFILALTSYGFIFLGVKTVRNKENRVYKYTIVPFYFTLAICSILIAFKYIQFNPALTDSLDSVGVIVYLVSCIGLLIALPFSNFPEWTPINKKLFKRLIIFPYIFFFIVFSLKFLLPEKAYRSFFFQNYAIKEKVYFNLDDYEIDEDITGQSYKLK